MNGEQSVLDRIDEVTVDSCHAPGCSRSLAESVSPWWCSEGCHRAWQAWHHDVTQLARPGVVELTPEQAEVLAAAVRQATRNLAKAGEQMAAAFANGLKGIANGRFRSGSRP